MIKKEQTTLKPRKTPIPEHLIKLSQLEPKKPAETISTRPSTGKSLI